MALIELRNVVGGYGGAPILNGVNMAIEQSDIGVIVGPNGAGKSTTLKAIFGLLKVTGGTIEFGGKNVANSLPDTLVPMGLSFVPQEKNVFTSMSVEENLEMDVRGPPAVPARIDSGEVDDAIVVGELRAAHERLPGGIDATRLVRIAGVEAGGIAVPDIDAGARQRTALLVDNLEPHPR